MEIGSDGSKSSHFPRVLQQVELESRFANVGVAGHDK